jgi:hypothetical protein
VTKPIAAVRLMRRLTGPSVTAVLMHATGDDDLEERAPEHGGVAARGGDEARSVGDEVGERGRLRDGGGEM